MHTEREAKFLGINKEEVREKLLTAGAICTRAERLMKRVTYDNPVGGASSYFRVRDEGDKITFTLKTEDKTQGIKSLKELEIEVSSFETMIQILEQMGFHYKAWQETKRENRHMPNEVEVTIDEWPGLKPFIEIEGESEELVRDTAILLGFDRSEALFGTVDTVAERELGLAPHIVNSISEITFEKPLKKDMV